MKNALVLHGLSNDSQGNWFPWLKKELEKKGWKVWVPDLPEADHPNVCIWNPYILDHWNFDKDSILIGHSAGSVEILSLLERLPENVVIDKAILVSVFKNNVGYEVLNGLFIYHFDWKKIKSHARKIILIHSDNDPYIPLDQPKFIAEKLGAELIIKKAQGHFNVKRGGPKYKKFPFLLELLEK